MKDRNPLISFLQSFGITLVVIGHSTYQLIHAGHTPAVYTWLYTFHMPLFFFISGYLLRHTSEKKGARTGDIPLFGRKGFITRKSTRLLLPYFVLSSMVFLPKTLLGYIALRPVDCSLHAYARMLLYPNDNVIGFYWFLPTLYIVFVMFMVMAKARLDKHLPVMMIVFLGANFAIPLFKTEIFGFADACTYIVFFMFGHYFRERNIEKMTARMPMTIAVCTFALSVILATIPEFNGIFFITGLNGIMMCVAFGQLYVRHRLTMFDHLDGANYTIYLLSWFPQVASQQLLIHMIPNIPWPVTTTLAFCTGLYIPLAIYRWTTGHKNIPAIRAIAPVIGA